MAEAFLIPTSRVVTMVAHYSTMEDRHPVTGAHHPAMEYHHLITENHHPIIGAHHSP